MGKKLYRVKAWDGDGPVDCVFEKNDWNSDEDGIVNIEIDGNTYGISKSEFSDLLQNYFGKY